MSYHYKSLFLFFFPVLLDFYQFIFFLSSSSLSFVLDFILLFLIALLSEGNQVLFKEKLQKISSRSSPHSTLKLVLLKRKFFITGKGFIFTELLISSVSGIEVNPLLA